MDKREEIRYGLIQWFAKYDARLERGNPMTVTETLNSLLSLLHSQGVAIRGISAGVTHPHLANYYTFESLIEE